MVVIPPEILSLVFSLTSAFATVFVLAFPAGSCLPAYSNKATLTLENSENSSEIYPCLSSLEVHKVIHQFFHQYLR